MAKSKKEKYEGSAADMAKDKRMARRRGIALDKWEGSAEDEAMDRRAAKKYRHGGLVARGGGAAIRGLDYSF